MSKSCVVFTEKIDGHTVHHWPSNFFIELDGTCVESEYQAEKFWLFDKPLAAVFVEGLPPYSAKRHGRAVKLSKRQLAIWERNKREIMLNLVRAKFSDHPELAELLLATGSGNIVEENWWHDDEWGHCICRKCFYRIGKNMLGEIIMQIREELGGEPAPTKPERWTTILSS